MCTIYILGYFVHYYIVLSCRSYFFCRSSSHSPAICLPVSIIVDCLLLLPFQFDLQFSVSNYAWAFSLHLFIYIYILISFSFPTLLSFASIYDKPISNRFQSLLSKINNKPQCISSRLIVNITFLKSNLFLPELEENHKIGSSIQFTKPTDSKPT